MTTPRDIQQIEPTVPALRLEQVALSLDSQSGRVDILRSIDFAIQAGETVGIVGPSGSGKTSLLMLMAGLERASSGTIEIAGLELGAASETELAALRARDVGIVFQSFHLVPTMTAAENVALPLEFAGAGDAFARAEEMLDRVGLGHRLTHFPAQLSGGEQQRVALARAIVNRPRILLADEPTGNLDARSGGIVVDQIFSLAAEKGVTLVLITHDRDLAERCGRVVSMADGFIVDDRQGAANASENAARLEEPALEATKQVTDRSDPTALDLAS
ncbi:MAG: ABC transporter ATP-binding protein [Pseudomonadota bacterium]